MAKDFYEILGIEKNATESDIKKAYRRKAMDLHPDKHKGDKQIEEQFKEVNKAYETLGDPQKRAAYDRFGEAGANFGGGGNSSGFGGSYDFSGFSGFDGGGQGFADIFEAFFTGFGANRNAPRKGRNLEFELRINFEEAAFGTEKELVITRPQSGDKKEDRLKVKIPAGVDNDSIIRLTGKGEPGVNGGPQGDLYVHIRINPHAEFIRNGSDVHSNKNLHLLQAVLGDEIKVKTIQGEVTLKIPAGTQPGKVFKLKGYGIKRLHTEEKGDHYVKVSVEIPTKLTKKEKQLFQEMAQESKMNLKSKGSFWG